jgi:hypothetical protein
MASVTKILRHSFALRVDAGVQVLKNLKLLLYKDFSL